MRRTFLTIAISCLLAIGVLVAGGVIWHRRQLDARVQAAIASLTQGGDGWVNEELLAEVARNPRYERERYLFHGALRLRSGEINAVFPALAHLRSDSRFREPLLLIAGETYYKTDRLPEAERAFLELVSLNPRNSRGHRWLATIYHDLGNIGATFAELEKVAEYEPDDYSAFRLMGMINLLDFQKNKEAADCYRKALERNPPAGQVQAVRRELAQALISMNDYSGALEILDAAQADAQVLAQRAECRWGLGERDEAVALLNQAITLNSEDRGALLLKARIDLEDGKPQLALKPLQTLLARDPHDFNTRYQLSRAYQALGDKETAAAELERMKLSQALLNQLSKLYFEAVQRPRDPAIRDEIANLCEQLDKPDLVKLWRRSAEYCRQISETPVFLPAEANR